MPLMVLGWGLSTKRAVSTDLASTLCTATVASIGHITTGFGDLSSLPPLIVDSMLGPLLGARLREWLPEKAIRLGFAGFMVVVALRTLGSAAGILWIRRRRMGECLRQGAGASAVSRLSAG